MQPKPSRDPESQLPFRFLASSFEKLAQLLGRSGPVADAVFHLGQHLCKRQLRPIRLKDWIIAETAMASRMIDNLSGHDSGKSA